MDGVRPESMCGMSASSPGEGISVEELKIPRGGWGGKSDWSLSRLVLRLADVSIPEKAPGLTFPGARDSVLSCDCINPESDLSVILFTTAAA